MALVDYSDSESESDAPAPAPKPPLAKPAFQRIVDRSAPGKIRVDLPGLKADSEDTLTNEPPSKRARTGGAFSGFNSLLPPPKRQAQNTPKPGISLKTSSEAAFSRTPFIPENLGSDINAIAGERLGDTPTAEKPEVPAAPKLIGKPTRFVPLSVANKKKKPPKNASPSVVRDNVPRSAQPSSEVSQSAPEVGQGAAQPKQKPKKSLFMASQDADISTPELRNDGYVPLLDTNDTLPVVNHVVPLTEQPVSNPANNNTSLEAVASDLNLTSAQRRQLFGRKGQNANIAHFNMETEYAANEELRNAGEVVEHRAVKAIAPGKHSLQQLVNNARSQQNAMEDAWAEGRRNRGESGSKYGWG